MMKRNILHFIATIVFALILSMFLPWWSVMVAAFITSLFFSLKRSAVFFIPFLAIALLWIVHSFWLSNTNNFILANKIAILLPLNGNPYLLISLTGFIGGLAAGVAAIFGKQCSVLVKKD
ncbi:hypothetical protein [Flavivirga spongiicola]|uniref:Uncharacterized protein n=1 Tax=Flavivirga spongiicola TaxID=421621 RepID=A0ABU7XT62_9FLAO|nr:hypothetical protein [Flavivirga sp. MEBiC05379]MDO5978766.1 hypothetical protein [Flavivirga sp. MEBiC05379]